MKRVAAGILTIALSMQIFSGVSTVNAAEVNVVENEIDESVYPAEWDEEDPQNDRAYEQLMGTSEISQTQPLLNSSGADTTISTTWNSSTYIHNDFNVENKTISVGMDVSYHQGTINWQKVKASGIEFAILRVGYRAYASGTIAEDKKFETYIADAQKVGIKVGAYFYSQAISEEEAIEEAKFVLEKIKEYNLDLPVAFDYEYAAEGKGRLYNAHLSKAQKTQNALAFCKTIEDAGYQAMVYASSSWFYSELNTAEICKNYDIWMARYHTYSYNETKDASSQRYGGQIDFWQCSDTAKVDGISTNVDLDYWYVGSDDSNDASDDSNEANDDGNDGSAVSTKWVKKNADGNWYYYVGDDIDYSYTGVAQNENGWWRIENGKVNFGYNGIAKNEYGWWYIRGGQVIFSYTGVAKNEYGWWRIENGKVNFDYTGIAKNEYGWWRIENGKVNFDYTGVAKNEYGWWRIENGKVNFSYNGIAQNEYGWWYIRGGKVNFNYTGVAKNEYGWWRVENGKVKFSYNGIAKNENGWWYIRGGKVIFSYTGWVTVASGKYWVTNGKVAR
jgi:GH25 family lysozyme M1 (1,4-beta-N-acetylmuramidase)